MSNKRELGRSTRNRAPARWLWITGLGAAVTAVAALLWFERRSSPAEADIIVYKTPMCGCCSDWVEHLRANDFEVAVVNVPSTEPIRSRVGVPRPLGSCHTAEVRDYWVEGHVPADLIERLITENPDDIQGIAVPAMPIGSPGMEGPNPVEYDVIAYDADGNIYVYATRQGHADPQ